MAEPCRNRTYPRGSSPLTTVLKTAPPTRTAPAPFSVLYCSRWQKVSGIFFQLPFAGGKNHSRQHFSYLYLYKRFCDFCIIMRVSLCSLVT